MGIVKFSVLPIGSLKLFLANTLKLRTTEQGWKGRVPLWQPTTHPLP